MIDQCLGNEDKLSAWENSFIESVNDRLDGEGFLTERQAEKLEEIYQRVT